MDDRQRILETAARGQLPDSLSEVSGLSIEAVRELVEAGYLTATDTSGFDGIEYLDPRITITGREYLRVLQARSPEPPDSLILVLQKLRDIMVSVATGKRGIDDVNEEYRSLFANAGAGLEQMGIANPVSFTDLWDWYGRWSSGDLPSYDSRRRFLGALFNPLFEQIRARRLGHNVTHIVPTGWFKVDRQVDEIRRRLAESTTEEQFQAVGLLCREVLISLGQTVHDPTRHPILDGVDVSDTDAKRKLDAFIAAELASASNESVRRHAKAAYTLATDLQHRRTATFREAALCVEATCSTVNVIAIISGKRDPDR